MTDIRPLRLYCNQDGVTSPYLYAVAPKRLTLHRDFNCGSTGVWQGSPFQEIEVVSPAVEPEVAALCQVYPTIFTTNPNDIGQALLPIIRQVIESEWRADKYHIIFGSSGNDTRIISGILRNLHEEKGMDWIGRILFVSTKWERESFKRLLMVQGWSVNQFLVYNENVPDEEYFAESLNLETAWQELNAPCPIPANLWWYIVRGLQKRGYLPPDDNSIQGFGGMWANEIFDAMLQWPKKWAEHHLNWYYYNVNASFPRKVSTIFPFCTLEVLRVLCHYDFPNNMIPTEKSVHIRSAMANTVSPETIDIPRLTLDDRKHPISWCLREKMLVDFNKTWYGKLMPQGSAAETTEFHPFWTHWSMASLCEYLLAQGHQIHIDNPPVSETKRPQTYEHKHIRVHKRR